ncbi:hypothetical protein HYV11_02735 [Candidatus Dependentiae bacterium]|nr:hypothetical protein [Candidatus Dependentiae bacterium]
MSDFSIKCGVIFCFLFSTQSSLYAVKKLKILKEINQNSLQEALDECVYRPISSETLLRIGRCAFLLAEVNTRKFSKNCFAIIDRQGEVQSLFVAEKKQKMALEKRDKMGKIVDQSQFECFIKRGNEYVVALFKMTDSSKQGYWEFVRQK